MAKDKKTMTNAMRHLKAEKINYELIEYEAEEIGDHFGAQIANLTGIEADRAFKTLTARGDKTGVFVMCVPVEEEIDLKKAARVSGNKRSELLHVKELLSVTGYERGSVSPIGMKKKYPTYINKTALDYDTIAISGGKCGVTLMISPGDLQKVTDCKFEDLIRRE